MNTIKIREIGPIKMCKRILKEQTTTNSLDVPFYKISTFGGVAESYITWDTYKQYKSKYSFPKAGDILISAAGTIGKTVIYHGEDAYFQDSNIVWIDNDEKKVLNQYLYYALKTIRWKTTDGSTIKRLYNDNILDLDIPFMNITQQIQISSILSTIDDKISANSKIIEISEKLMHEIYDYWFVQFDFPDENGRPYKSSGGEMVYNETLKREIPKGWNVINIEDLAQLTWGQCPDGTNILSTSSDTPGIPYCSGAGDMDGGYIVDCQAKTNNSRREVSGGTILLSIAGTIGKMAIANEKISLGRATLGVAPTKSNHYAIVWLLLKMFNSRLKAASVGAVQKIINKNNMKEINVAIPSNGVMDYGTLNDLMLQITTLSLENKKLAFLRDWLLPMLMNGQVAILK